MRTLVGKKNTTSSDWHPADVVAALHKAGWSLRQLSIECGYSEGTLRKALRHGWPKAEKIIAAALDLEPEDIWPERYTKRSYSPSLPSAIRLIRRERRAA